MYGDRPEPVEAATSFVASRFPEAAVAFVGGSVLTEDRTPTSDLDVVVVVPEEVVVADSGMRAPYRETFEHDGWVVEAFVHTRASLDRYWASDAERRVCSLLRMCLESVVLVDRDGSADGIRVVAATLMAQGPPAYTDAELAAVRYGLTDLLDDMAGCDREDELVYLASAVVQEVATVALVSAGRWAGRGKALARALRADEPDLAERLVDGHRHVVMYGDTVVLHRAAVDVLLRVGGPLMDGHRVGGEPPAATADDRGPTDVS
jgi:hypothetical protein